MSKYPIISIVGRPNVGKSSLFNRILRKRVAVVDDFPGVTRDRNYVKASWDEAEFILVDTGGLIPSVHESIPEAIHEQVNVAMEESAVVVFVVEAGTGITDLDLLIAKQLRRSFASKTILAVNKAESSKVLYDIDSFRTLGLGDPYPVSALHGKGVGDLLDEALSIARESFEEPFGAEEEPEELKVAIVGRPNAGKSSLVNKFLRQNRMIVDSKAGTTRDAVDSQLQYGDRTVVLIDTAGLRKKSHVKEDMEYYSNLRAIDSIERCDVCILMVDVSRGVGVQDLRILRKAFETRKGVVLALNKWDLLSKDHKTYDNLIAEIRHEYNDLKYVPVISVSALTGQRTEGLLKQVFEVRERMEKKLGAAEFENQIFEWVRVHPHPINPGKEVRFLGAKQVKVPFPLFRFFVTNPQEVSAGYVRYLTKRINEKYDFTGCPVVLEFRPIARGRSQKGSSSAQDSDTNLQEE
ncbi:MAG: ribosome biogenesis GTPase Der [Chitinispirillaceae bacterium]